MTSRRCGSSLQASRLTPSNRERRITRASRSGSSAGSGKSLDTAGFKSPILGKNFRIPDLYSELPEIELDDTLAYVPIYCHFVVPEIEPIIRPKTPPILTALRAEFEELQLLKPAKAKPEQRSRNTHHTHRQSTNKNH